MFWGFMFYAWGNILFQTSEKQTLQLWLASMSYFRFLIWRSFFLSPPSYFGEVTDKERATRQLEEMIISM